MSRKNKEKRLSKRPKMSVSTGASFVPPPAPAPEASDEEEQAPNPRRVPKGYMTAEVAAARLGLSPANFVAIHRSRVMRHEFANDGMNYIKESDIEESDIEEIERLRVVRQQVMTTALVSKAVQSPPSTYEVRE